MGVDIYGRKFTKMDEEEGPILSVDADVPGAYWCSSFWPWRPIVDIMHLVNEWCGVGLPQSAFIDIGTNDGNGFDEGPCGLMASGMRDVLASAMAGIDHPGSITVLVYDEKLLCIEGGSTMHEVHYNRFNGTRYRDRGIAHSILVRDLETWIAFLDNCGGFMVY